jgi:hypothetical protein
VAILLKSAVTIFIKFQQLMETASLSKFVLGTQTRNFNFDEIGFNVRIAVTNEKYFTEQKSRI